MLEQMFEELPFVRKAGGSGNLGFDIIPARYLVGLIRNIIRVGDDCAFIFSEDQVTTIIDSSKYIPRLMIESSCGKLFLAKISCKRCLNLSQWRIGRHNI